MAKRFITVLFVVLLMVCLAVFSYADASDFDSFTNITSSFSNRSTQKYEGVDCIIIASALDDNGNFSSYSFSNNYDYQFVFTTSSTSSNIPALVNYSTPYGSSPWKGSLEKSGNTYTLTFNRADFNRSSFNGWVQLPASNFASISNFAAYRGTLKTEPEPHNIIVSSSSGGTASADVSSAVEGTTVNLIATPAAGYQFDRWEVVSGGVTISNNQFVMPDNEVVISAVFSPIQYSISVSSDGNGSVSSSVSTATAGTTVTLTATPAANYVFSEWQVLEGDIDIVNNQFIMPGSNVSVKAIFVPDGTHSVTVENDGYGVGSANPVRAEQGTRITLSAVPVLGYEFDSWEVVSGSVNISNNQFIMPDSDVVVRAKFKPIVYTITLNQGSNGSATVSQTTGIIGDVITLTASPDEGFSFSHWNIIQGDITVENNQFVMPASNVVIEPVFLEITAISSGFKYNSGQIDGSYSSHYDVLDINFGDVPAGDYLLNIYHWGGSYNARFGLYFGDKYLAFSSADGLSTTAIEHKGGEFRLYGGLDLVRASTVSADAHVVWISNYGGSGTLDLDNPTTWTFNIEDVVLIPVSKSHLEDYGSVSSLVAFLRDKFDDLISVFGSEEAEEDVGQAQESLDKEVEELGQLSADLTEQSSNLEQQFNTDFAVPDEVTGSTSSIQAIYNFLFSSLGIFSIFIWLPVVLAVIRKLLRL